jgi:MFS family permease
MIIIMTTLQDRVPDALRGRVMGIFGMTWSMMTLGAMQAGFIAEAVSAPFAVALGGVAVAVFTLAVAVASAQVRRLGPAPQ